MKLDAYTKIILTVIAANLTFHTIKNIDFIPSAHAAENNVYESFPEEKVQSNVMDVRIVSSPTLNVNIKDTDYGAFDNAGDLDVKLVGASSGVLRYAGPMDVEMD